MEREREENIWTRKILREGKYLVRGGRMEKDKEEIIRRRKIDGEVDRPSNRLDI